MKKIFITALSLILTASVFAGCADNKQSSENNQGSQNSESTQSSESTESSTESTQSTPESAQIDIDGITFSVSTEDFNVIKENNKSIELTDEQKAVIDAVFSGYAKMALLFFYHGFDTDTRLSQFDGTGYDCKLMWITAENNDGLPEDIVNGLEYPAHVKYTGDKVNTLEKFNAERAKYFTDEYIKRQDTIEIAGSSETSQLFYFEGNGALYKSFFDADIGYVNYYIHSYEETDDEINIEFFCVTARFEASYTNISMNLKKTENGFLINSIKQPNGYYFERDFAQSINLVTY